MDSAPPPGCQIKAELVIKEASSGNEFLVTYENTSQLLKNGQEIDRHPEPSRVQGKGTGMCRFGV